MNHLSYSRRSALNKLTLPFASLCLNVGNISENVHLAIYLFSKNEKNIKYVHPKIANFQ